MSVTSMCFALLAGCQSLQTSEGVLAKITPYRLEIVQGNVITKEQVALIKPGMSRAQVRDVLGSPLLSDLFHVDRWDYVFTIRRGGTELEPKAVVVLFDGDKMKSIETASELPAEREFVASIDSSKSSRPPPSLTLTDEQRKALPAPPRQPAVDAVPDVAARTYPPLEPGTP
ncbi:MAG: outer membrane protein assembly factor BamE [Caldimonas sp.]